MKQGKVWGTTQTVILEDGVSVHVLTIRKGGFSSEHRHEKKANVFAVISGRLEIRIWQGDAEVPDDTQVGPGEKTGVLPGVWHQFLALEDTVAIEVCEVPPATWALEADMERRSRGGRE
jgi:mannose-6-phosphate isomerase-like protein (cupin superfamily)